MENDLTPTRTIGLLLMAAIFYLSMIWSSFYNEDSPIQFRVLNCHIEHATAAQCPLSLVWAK